MGVSFVAGFGDNAGEVHFARSDLNAEFFSGFTAGAGVRRFAGGSVEFSAGRAPKAEIGFLRAMHQKHFVMRVKAIEESGNLVRQVHTK